MSDISLSDALIKVGKRHPDLRDDLEPIIDRLKRESREKSGIGRGGPSIGGGGPDPYSGNVRKDHRMSLDEIISAVEKAENISGGSRGLAETKSALREFEESGNRWLIDQASDAANDALQKAESAAKSSGSKSDINLYGLMKNIHRSIQNLR